MQEPLIKFISGANYLKIKEINYELPAFFPSLITQPLSCYTKTHYRGSWTCGDAETSHETLQRGTEGTGEFGGSGDSGKQGIVRVREVGSG